MSESLDIHPASEDERLAAFRNVHDIWSSGYSLEEHLQRRLSSVQHKRADWFVGCLEGKVVTSLACYPIQFCLNGQIEKGISIGSVHTLEEYRGRGFAPRLIQWVDAFQRDAGTILSMLYSDINPNYYARLGYQLCPSREGWSHPVDVAEKLINREGSLVQPTLPADRQIIQKFYEQYHSRFVISIARHEEYWDFLFRKNAADQFYFLLNSTGDRLGYVRLGGTSEKITIRDWALADHSASLSEILFGAVIREALQNGVEQLGGWLPNVEPLRSLFTLKEREIEITMLKSLKPGKELSEEVIASAEHFQEIDHV